MMKCNHRYESDKLPIKLAMSLARDALMRNMPFEAMAHIEKYYAGQDTQEQVDSAVDFIRTRHCQACETAAERAGEDK